MAAASNASNSQAAPLTVLITGANRGIGLALATQYAAQPHVRVVATARDPTKADALQALAKAHPKRVHVVALDVADAKSVAALPAALGALQPAVSGVDVLINNAGIIGAGGSAQPVAGTALFAGLEHETHHNWMEVYRVNVVGPWDVTQRVLPLLRAAASRHARVVNVSSLVGQFEFTVDGNLPGGAAAYRASKTALNELSAVQAREYNHATVTAQAAAAAAPGDAKAAAAASAAAPLITVLTVHPGVVETDMAVVGGFAKLPITVGVDVSAAGIIKLAADAKPNAKVAFLDAITQKPLAW